MNIRKLVKSLKRKYKTDSPYELADYLNIEVLHYDIGTYSGCYIYLKKHKCVILNNNLDDYKQKLVMAHELGHALLHGRINCYFMRDKTFLNTSIYEREANKFAVELLISDDDIAECQTIGQISTITGIPKEIVMLRLNK